MIVVLDEQVERSLLDLAGLRRAGETGLLLELAAILHEAEDRIVVGIPGQPPVIGADIPGVPLRCHTLKLGSDETPARPAGPEPSTTAPALVLGVTGMDSEPLQAFLYSGDTQDPESCDIEVVRLETDLFSRVKGIFDTRLLASKTLSVIGVGSGGSLAAVELAKSGVGNFILVDFDRLKAHNISRHVCGLADIGRFKTRAVRDVIQQHNPEATVECHEVDITEEDELLQQIVKASDLVLVGTDNQLSRYLINEECLAGSTPAIYGGAYEKAFAGEVIRVIPGVAGCYACVRQGLANTMGSISSQQDFDYTDDPEFVAEPGLGMDVSFIAMIQAKLALLTLLRDTESSLDDIDAEMIIWVNSARPEDGDLFSQPMARYFVRVSKVESCPSCGTGSDVTSEEVGDVP